MKPKQISSKAKKSPWIPPPALTSKRTPKKCHKVHFCYESPITKLITICKCKEDEFDFGNDQQDLAFNDFLNTDINKTDDLLQQLNVTQRQSLEASRQRLNDLRKSFKVNDAKIHDSKTVLSPLVVENDNEIDEQISSLVSKLRNFEANSSSLRQILKNKPAAVETERTITAATQEIGEANAGSVIDDVKTLQAEVHHLNAEKQSLLDRNKTLENNREILQKELGRREINESHLKYMNDASFDKDILSDRLQSMKSEMEKIKLNFITDKTGLLKAIKYEQKKNEKYSKALQSLKNKLVSKDKQIEMLMSDCEVHKKEIKNLVQIRDLAETELSVLRERIEELEVVIEDLGSKKQFEAPQELSEKNLKLADEAARAVIIDRQHMKSGMSKNSRDNLLDISNLNEELNSTLKTELNHQLSDQSKLILQLSQKIEKQAEHIKLLSEVQKVPESSAEKKIDADKIESLHRTIQELEKSNFEVSVKLAKSEQALQYTQARLDEKTKILNETGTQNELALASAKNQLEELQEKNIKLEKELVIVKSESNAQLYQAKNEISALKSENISIDKQHRLKLADLTDQLEHSQSANRSLQNYITFLKNSYANVFSDANLSPQTTPSAVS